MNTENMEEMGRFWEEEKEERDDRIVIRGLSKAYGDHTVLDGFSLSIPMGCTTCIMAPSGAGKTTLLRILMGLESPDGGTVRGLEGKRISAVFQEPRLCENLSALANIRIVRKRRLWEKDREGLEEIRRGMEALGLSSCIRQPVREMSGGMRQRVALLRALYARWDVLFLDEPFQGLDQESKERTMAYAKAACRKRTVILVTHSREEATKMGEIVSLPHF